MDAHIDLAVKRYSMLFTLPSQSRIVLILFLLCVFGGVLSVLPMSFSLQTLFFGLFFGTTFFTIVVASDVITKEAFLRNDVIYNLKRCLAVSLFSSFAWFALNIIGGLLLFIFHEPLIWFKLSLIGFSAATILRLIVLLTTAFHSRIRIFTSALLQPTLCLIPLYTGWAWIGQTFSLQLLLSALVSFPIAMTTAFIFIVLIDRVGKKNF